MIYAICAEINTRFHSSHSSSRVIEKRRLLNFLKQTSWKKKDEMCDIYKRWIVVNLKTRYVDRIAFSSKLTSRFCVEKKKIKCVIYINVNQRCDLNVENLIYTKWRYVNFDLCDMCWIRFWFSLVTFARRFCLM